MHAFRYPSPGGDTLHRAPSSSVRDFEQLVSNAFDRPSPAIVLTPAHASASGPWSAISLPGRTTAKSYLEDAIEDDRPRFHRPRSQSSSAFSLHRTLPSTSPMHGEPSSRPGITRRVLKSLRDRASALMLRPSHTPHGSVSNGHIPASMSTLAPWTSTSTSSARSPSRHNAVSQSQRLPFPSRGDNSTLSTLRGVPGPNVELGVKVSVARRRTSSLPLNVLKIPQHSYRDGPRSARTPSPLVPRSKSPAPTLLGDLISMRRNTGSSFSSSRGRTSSQLSTADSSLRVHTRLPPLNKSRSFNLLSEHNRKHSRASSIADSFLPSPTVASSMSIEFEEGELPAWCPEPYTNPRPPPPTPTSPAREVWRLEDGERLPNAPSYVSQRRDGSASIHSAATAKSTQTLADRIIQAIPRSLKASMFRSRSKLNLSVITSSSNESTLSSSDTSMFSSGTGSLPPTPHSSSFPGVASDCRMSVDSPVDAMAVDRVLTPEEDPFAKSDIEVPRSRTPMPFETLDSSSKSTQPPLGRNALLRPMRKRSSGSGHMHTNSGDTITPLTSGLDDQPCSPTEVDGPYMDYRPFVFPTPAMTVSSLSPSPSPTPYSDWSPIGLRQNATLPNVSDFSAHIVPLPFSPTLSRRSVSSPIPPSPGPPPNIPLPPSPMPLRTEFISPPPSPSRLRKRKSQSSLCVAALLNAERPPSPFPMAASAFSSMSPLLGLVKSPTNAESEFVVSELDRPDDNINCPDGMLSRSNGGWARGPRFALSGMDSEPTRPAWPMSPRGSSPPKEVVELDETWRHHQLPVLSSEFSALGFSFDNKPYPPSLARLNAPPRVRPSHSDSALCVRFDADAHLQHMRTTSHDVYSRGGPAVALGEIKERWEGDTVRSTAFYSARSSMLSNISSVMGTIEALPDA